MKSLPPPLVLVAALLLAGGLAAEETVLNVMVFDPTGLNEAWQATHSDPP